jgi:hypothetical protein
MLVWSILPRLELSYGFDETLKIDGDLDSYVNWMDPLYRLRFVAVL